MVFKHNYSTWKALYTHCDSTLSKGTAKPEPLWKCHHRNTADPNFNRRDLQSVHEIGHRYVFHIRTVWQNRKGQVFVTQIAIWTFLLEQNMFVQFNAMKLATRFDIRQIWHVLHENQKRNKHNWCVLRTIIWLKYIAILVNIR